VASAQVLIDSESALSAGLMRMAPTDQEPARGTGELLAFDPQTRMATIRHGDLDSIGWPAMDTAFAVRADIAVARLMAGQQIKFEVIRGADGLLYLSDIAPDDGIAATGMGMVEAVTADGKLTMSHDPIPELGWPAMVMDMPVSDIDAGQVPLGTQVAFDLAEDADGMFVIVAVRPVDESVAVPPDMAEPDMVAEMMAAEPIVVAGTIDAIDAETRRATITHAMIKETGMPGMTMDFDLVDALDIAGLPVGSETTLTFERPDGMTMVLAAAETVAPPIEVSGTINAIDPSGNVANISHGPMTDIGMPGMTMDFGLSPSLDVGSLPLGEELTLLMTRNPDFSMTLVGVVTTQQVGQ
jgi:Cu(I)/Ag(I) efflux system membrane fusion protein